MEVLAVSNLGSSREHDLHARHVSRRHGAAEWVIRLIRYCQLRQPQHRAVEPEDELVVEMSVKAAKPSTLVGVWRSAQSDYAKAASSRARRFYYRRGDCAKFGTQKERVADNPTIDSTVSLQTHICRIDSLNATQHKGTTYGYVPSNLHVPNRDFFPFDILVLDSLWVVATGEA
jgi:hypothetical protein